MAPMIPMDDSVDSTEMLSTLFRVSVLAPPRSSAKVDETNNFNGKIGKAWSLGVSMLEPTSPEEDPRREMKRIK